MCLNKQPISRLSTDRTKIKDRIILCCKFMFGEQKEKPPWMLSPSVINTVTTSGLWEKKVCFTYSLPTVHQEGTWRQEQRPWRGAAC